MKSTTFNKAVAFICSRLFTSTLALMLVCQVTARAQEGSGAPAQSETSSADATAKPVPTPEELEAKFTEALANVTFQGRWSSIRNGQLGPEREEKYSIISASKISSETWIIQSRIQYGDRNFVAPIPVKVKWAGDTPVITVDDLAMPGGTNKYSARVLVYNGAYAGWWSGGTRGGLLNGIIVKNDK